MSAPRGCGPRGRGPGGFTLTEVVVALVIFGSGLLGVAGMGIRAVLTLEEARATAWAVASAGEVADSLARWGVSADGAREHARGLIAWRVEEGPYPPTAGEGMPPARAMARVAIAAEPASGRARPPRRVEVVAIVPLAAPPGEAGGEEGR